jgi:16S rRNA processing protein RimM
MSERVIIGEITKPHGMNGSVYIHPLTFDEQRFFDISSVFLDDGRSLTIDDVNVTNKGVIVTFREVTDRNSAELLAKKRVLVEETERIDLPEDTYFYDDLIDCEVFGKENKRIGKVVNILENPANDIYVVQDENGKESMIPAIEIFVKKVDVKNKRIDIEEIPGLIS